MKKKFMENKKFRLIAVFLITVFIVGGFSFAWFYVRKNQYYEMSVANFQATPVCYFDGTTKDISEFTDENGLIKLSVAKEDKKGNPIENYIGNFRVDVKYTGDGAGYLRVKMVHEFSNGSESVQHPADLPYATNGELWVDNRSNDYCYYYKGDSNDKGQLDADGKEETLTLITGLADGGDATVEGFEEADVEIKVAVEADMVQINRYPQIWGIEDLPW